MYHMKERYPDIIDRFPELEMEELKWETGVTRYDEYSKRQSSNVREAYKFSQFREKINNWFNQFDRNLLNRMAKILTSLEVEQISSGEQIGLQVSGDIKKANGKPDDPRVHVEVTLAKSSGVVLLTLSHDGLVPIPVNLPDLSNAQRLQLAIASQELNDQLRELFGSQVSLNDILENAGSYSFIFDSQLFQRQQGGLRDL